MANGSSVNDEPIVAINVTPLVDVVLVLLIVLMVAATSLAAKSLSLDLPRAATGEVTDAPLAISLDQQGRLFLDGVELDLQTLQKRTRAARAKNPEVRAVIAADGSARHQSVVSILDTLRKEGVFRFALNVDPDELSRP
jgi:biopolymer transport protein ExbD